MTTAPTASPALAPVDKSPDETFPASPAESPGCGVGVGVADTDIDAVELDDVELAAVGAAVVDALVVVSTSVMLK